MNTHDAAAADPAQRLPWPILPAFLPLLYLWLTWSWWAETRVQIEAIADAAAPTNAGAMAAVAVAGRALAVLSEAACYALWWKSRHLRLPYWRFVCWVAALSTADLFGFTLRRAAEDAPELLRMIAAALAGPATLEAGAIAGSGGAVAFGSLGVLALLRIGMTAWAQARGIGLALAGPLLLTLSAWLLTRLLGWWSFDLLKGLSPVP